MAVSEKVKQRIDDWIRRTGRNEYGDAPQTVYPGGNPLFNERSPGLRDRYEYILSRYPELGHDDQK
jgi:hypothetical protein